MQVTKTKPTSISYKKIHTKILIIKMLSLIIKEILIYIITMPIMFTIIECQAYVYFISKDMCLQNGFRGNLVLSFYIAPVFPLWRIYYKKTTLNLRQKYLYN